MYSSAGVTVIAKGHQYQNPTVPNMGLTFAMTSADNNRLMNGVGVKIVQQQHLQQQQQNQQNQQQQHQIMMPWGADSLPMFPASTTITAANPMAVAQAGTSFLSNLGGLTPITFANTTITTTGGRSVMGQQLQQQPQMTNCAVMDPMLVFSTAPSSIAETK